MAADPTGYALDNPKECERLELQARLARIHDHLRYVPVRPGARILDAGCGSGAIARLFAAHYPDSEVVGVDINPRYVAWARQRAAVDRLGNLTFQEGDLHALPFPDASFDVVWQKKVLHFLDRPEAVIAEFRRVTRPGGVVACCNEDGGFSNHVPPAPGLQERLTPALAAVVDHHLGSKLPLLFRQAGLEAVEVDIDIDWAVSTIGAMDPARLDNMRQMLDALRPRFAVTLGSEAEADRLNRDLLAYLANPATTTIHPLNFVRGRVPLH